MVKSRKKRISSQEVGFRDRVTDTSNGKYFFGPLPLLNSSFSTLTSLYMLGRCGNEQFW